jgi:NADPH:quinone reductase-like Zn-dependent oxidoreductase
LQTKPPLFLKDEKCSSAALADGATDAFVAVTPWLQARPGADVLIIGGSGQSLGLFSVQIALSRGAGRVVYLDHSAERLARANSLGAEI